MNQYVFQYTFNILSQFNSVTQNFGYVGWVLFVNKSTSINNRPTTKDVIVIEEFFDFLTVFLHTWASNLINFQWWPVQIFKISKTI